MSSSKALRAKVKAHYLKGARVEDLATLYDLGVDEVRSLLGPELVKEVDLVEKGALAVAIERAVPNQELGTIFASAYKWSPFAADMLERLRTGAAIAGIHLEDHLRLTLARMLEKVIGGMRLEVAAERSGMGIDEMKVLLTKVPRLNDLFLEAQHVVDMRNLEGVSQAVVKGDGKLALDVLSRQTGDFAPAEKRVSVRGGNLRQAWNAVDAIEADYEDVTGGSSEEDGNLAN